MPDEGGRPGAGPSSDVPTGWEEWRAIPSVRTTAPAIRRVSVV
jgi:hypothetical protein